MSKRDWRVILADILESINKIENYVVNTLTEAVNRVRGGSRNEPLSYKDATIS